MGALVKRIVNLENETFESEISMHYLGQVSFQEGRRLQSELRSACSSGKETVLFCEHPKTITAGKRSHGVDIQSLAASIGAESAYVDRGGHLTYHGPGQLLVYPVIALRRRRMGVREFVSRGLEAAALTFCEYGLEAKWRLDPAGVWISNGESDKKLAAVGLSIKNGISDHGFSLNLAPSLAPYSVVNCCGLAGECYTSIAQEVEKNTQIPNMESFAVTFFTYFQALITSANYKFRLNNFRTKRTS